MQSQKTDVSILTLFTLTQKIIKHTQTIEGLQKETPT